MPLVVPRDWRPSSRIDSDVVVELDHIVNRVMNECRLPRHDPYLIDVCLAAMKEIQKLRAEAPKPLPDEMFFGG